jgi:hypothetical protein
MHAWRLQEEYLKRRSRSVLPTVMATGETHNFTYDLTERNLRYLVEMIAVATGRAPNLIEQYILEAINDRELREYFDQAMLASGSRPRRDILSPFGRRLGWYAIVRVTRPRVVVETGVERGHGALLLSAALLRNTIEGAPGHYFGTDINPQAGWLLSGKYAAVGQILYGDSITSLKALEETVDLFINDSDHSADYEAEEYAIMAPKLSPHAIILSDNAHVTDRLAVFSRRDGRHFLMFSEEPKDHWYPGAGIGISFPAKGPTDA